MVQVTAERLARKPAGPQVDFGGNGRVHLLQTLLRRMLMAHQNLATVCIDVRRENRLEVDVEPFQGNDVRAKPAAITSNGQFSLTQPNLNHRLRTDDLLN